MASFESSFRQLRLAGRSLARRPTLTLTAVVTLALGIGANTAIFSVINVVLLKPLPFKNPSGLVMVWSSAADQGLAEGFSSYPDFHDWREQSRSFEQLAALWLFPNGDVNLTGGSEPERVPVARVTAGFFETLGAVPLHGRTFQEEESVVGNHRRAMLSYALWNRRFGADTSLVGRSVLVNGFPYTVVGIMPPHFRTLGADVLGSEVELWRPLVPEDNQTGGRGSRKLRVVGRLRDGVSRQQAEAELAGVASRLAEVHPETNRGIGVRLIQLREQVVGDVRRGLFFLGAAVGIVLLGACTNVANLLLMKAAAGRKQLAVQHALGASRFQLATQVLSESLLLSVLGAVAGLLLALGGVRAFIAIGPREIPLLADARIDGLVLAFTAATATLTAIMAGILPAWQASRRDATPILRQGGGRSPGSDDRRMMRSLAVSQIALALLLLAAGILLTRSFRALLGVDPGFDPRRVLSFKLELPMATTYPSQEERDAFYATLLERVDNLPGVEAATLTSTPPIEEESSLMNFTTPGRADDRVLQANFRIVAPNYFSLLGIPIRAGRAFTASDNRSGPRVAIISETLARSIWGSESPLGRMIQTSFGGAAEVVGVAADVRTNGLDNQPGRTVYGAASQATYNFMTILVKGPTDPRVITPTIRQAVRDLDPDLPLYHVRTIEELMMQSVAQQRFLMLLVGSFSLLVFALAVVGTYGVVSYGVSERTGELGVRMALGATGDDIQRLVIREGARLALAGIVIGSLAAIALSRTVTKFVFQISTLDPVTFTLAPLLLGSAALIAVLVPAHRAARVDPMRALRAD